jgi:hypothetical protein
MQTIPRSPTPFKSALLEIRRTPAAILDDVFSPPFQAADPAEAAEWQEIVEHKLPAWEREPQLLADDGIEPPTKATVLLALRVARSLRKRSPPPTRVVPDADGGIVFEREDHDVLETVRVNPDGTVEYCRFRNARLLERFEQELPGTP